jgi:uncharacterized membrane protein
MALLIAGVLLWSIVHFIPAGASGLRSNLVASMGEGPWKGVFSLLLLASIALMVFGWRSIEPSALYMPPEWGKHTMMLLIFVAIVLIGAAQGTSIIKRYVRHPMLLGFALWGIAHLTTNGEDRSVVLFGGLTLWALIMIPFLNKRDGAYEKPEAAPISGLIRTLVISAVIFAVLFFAHPYYTGVRPMDYLMS